MRILHVTREQTADRRYGLGKSLAPILEAMAQRGHIVRYLCQEDLTPAQRSIRDSRIQWLRQWPGIRGRANRGMLVSALGERLQMGWQAAKLAAEENFTHVHLHDPWMAFGFFFGKYRYFLHDVRWGITEHGFGCYSQATHDDGLPQGNGMQRLLRHLEALILTKANWVIAPTRLALAALARDLAQAGLPSNWHCVPHARPTNVPEDKAQARAQLGWNNDCLVVVAVGRIVPLKHFEKILAACIALSTKFPALHLQLLGEGSRESLEAQARQFNFEDRLHIAVTDRVEDYLAASDIYISMSATESFGLANLEALCAGLPSLCSAVGGVPEVTGDGAWLIPHDEDILTRCLGALLAAPELRQAWRERALRHTSTWPNCEDVCDAYLAIYQA